jgi:hypothetical protein
MGLLGMALLCAAFLPQRAAADDNDPASRVARLSYLKGPVSFNPAGTEDWASADLNRPMTTGDKLWTDRDGRAELQVGSAALRLSGGTGFSFLNLTDHIAQIRLTEGTLNVRLKRLDENETIEVDAPNLAFSLMRPGDYRIEVNEAGDSTVIVVRSGEGEVTGGGEAFTVHAEQRVTFSGADQLSSTVETAGDYDDFDDWCRDRDRRENGEQSTRYVSRDVIGYEDLDENGDWQPAPDYGYVWVPRTVVVGWAPYRYGHWVWIWPWGWTWVDDASWGFAPFHYGRWIFWRARWCWVPGPVVVRPVYAPALVAWVGGPRWSVSVSVGGGVAWFPLGPREVYLPPYAVSRTYVTNVNVTNTSVNNVYVNNVYNSYTVNHVTNIRYVNQSVPGGVTATSQQTFTSAHAVHTNLLRVNEKEIAAAQVSNSVAVAPQQRSVLGAGQSNVTHPPASRMNRGVVARTAPPPQPVPFSTQQKVIQANDGRPLSQEQVQQLHKTDSGQTVRSNIRVAPPATRHVPVEMVSRPKNAPPSTPERAPVTSGPPGQPQQNGPAPQTQRAPQPYRDDRPPSSQRPITQTPPVTPADRAGNHATGAATSGPPAQPNPTRPVGPPARPSDLDRRTRDQVKLEDERQKLEQKHAQEQENLRVRQEQQHQKLEQKTQRQQEKAPKSEDKSKPKGSSSDRKN